MIEAGPVCREPCPFGPFLALSAWMYLSTVASAVSQSWLLAAGPMALAWVVEVGGP